MIVPTYQAQAVPTQVQAPQPTPTQSASFLAAVAGAQATAKPVAPQTSMAAQPAGKSEEGRNNPGGAGTGQYSSSGTTGTTRARSASSDTPWRGQTLDITV